MLPGSQARDDLPKQRVGHDQLALLGCRSDFLDAERSKVTCTATDQFFELRFVDDRDRVLWIPAGGASVRGKGPGKGHNPAGRRAFPPPGAAATRTVAFSALP